MSKGIPRRASAACGGMEVEYWSGPDAAPTALHAERFNVVIPGDAGAVELGCAADGTRARRTWLCEPYVGLVAPGPVLAIAAASSGDGIAIALPREAVEPHLEALGVAVDRRGTLTEVADARLVRTGRILLGGFRAGRTPPGRFLETLAADLARDTAHAYAHADRLRPGKLAPHRLQRVYKLVEERLGQPLPIADLAAAANLSMFHFMRMFREACGQSPHAYVTARRMEHAKKLLAQTRMPIAQVAYASGYQTQAHFTGVFHKHVGMTPRAWRLRHAAEATRNDDGADQARDVR